MTPLERLFTREVEFHRRLREAGDGQADASALHTSWALQSGYEQLIRQAGNVAVEDVLRLAQRLAMSGDDRDVCSARDSLVRLLGIRQFGKEQ